VKNTLNIVQPAIKPMLLLLLNFGCAKPADEHLENLKCAIEQTASR
jgi:hypothetical protein